MAEADVIDDDWFAALYARSYRTVVLVALARTQSRPEAEEAAQEAFVRGYAHRRRLAAMASPEAWLATVALNVVRRRRRRQAHHDELVRRMPLPSGIPDAATPESADLYVALRTLPLPMREVLVLHHLADLPLDQVAAILRVPAGTVKSRLHRARTALAETLRNDDRQGAEHD